MQSLLCFEHTLLSRLELILIDASMLISTKGSVRDETFTGQHDSVAAYLIGHGFFQGSGEGAFFFPLILGAPPTKEKIVRS
jgi:hypothetical protein